MTQKVFCIGDSLTYGSPECGNTYPQGLQYLLDHHAPGKFKVSNHSVPGEISASTANRFGVLLHFQRPDILIVGTGANDMFQGIDNNTLKTHLSMMCQAAKNYNTKLLLLGMPNWHWGNPQNEDNPVYEQVGKEQGIPVQSGGYRACLNNPQYAYDTVHLNPWTQGYLGYSFHVLDSFIKNNWL